MILCRNQGHLPTFGPALLHLYGSTRDYWFVDEEDEEEEEDATMMVMMLDLYGSTRDYLLVDRNMLTWYKN